MICFNSPICSCLFTGGFARHEPDVYTAGYGSLLPSRQTFPPTADERQCERFMSYDVAAALKRRH